MTSSCPPIEILQKGTLTDDVALHLQACAGCRAIFALCSVRSTVEQRSSMPEAACATYEPDIAAMIDGTLDADASVRLVEHLTQCASCNEVAAAVSLVREDIHALPEPERIGDHPTRPAFPSWLPRTAVARSVQLVLVAAVFLFIGFWLARPTVEVPVLVTPEPSVARPDAPQLEAVTALPAGSIVHGPSVVAPTPRPDDADLDHQRLDSKLAPAPAPSVALPHDGSMGYFSLSCRPQCDRVVAHGANLGPSPIERHRTRTGELTIVAHRGDRQKSVTVSIKPNQVSTIALNMDDAIEPGAGETGYISVLCSPFCERVLIDGVDAGSSPLVHHRVSAGEHELTLVRGQERKIHRIAVKPGTTFSLRAQMSGQASDDAHAHVSVACSPNCERIYIDGKDVGPSPLGRYRVTPGAHEFVFVRGKERKTKRLVVDAGTIVPLRVLMSETGM